MKYVCYYLSLILLFSCNGTKTVEPVSTGGNANVNAPYEWDLNSFPRNLKISDDFTDEEVGVIQAKADSWERVTGLKKNFFEHGSRTEEVSSRNLDLDGLGDDNVNGIYKITSWPLSLSGGALAVTQIFGQRFNSGKTNEYVQIIHADILVNENNYNFRTTDGIANSFDLGSVVLHELGHFLGLGHKYGDTVMVPSIGNLTTFTIPTEIDAADLADKYGISLGLTPASAMVTVRPRYVPDSPGSGVPVKILIELLSDGECVHKENGVVLKRHRAIATTP